MKTVHHNLRWVSSLLALAILLVSSVSGASWQCLDGSPCPMSHHRVQTATAPAPIRQLLDSGQKCSHCQGGASGVRTHTRSTACATTPHCVLRASRLPGASLQTPQIAFTDLLALQPTNLLYVVTTGSHLNVPPAEPSTPSLLCWQQPASRAPPTLL